MNVKELAAYLGLSVETIYAWIYMRKIPYYKVGRLPRFDLAEINVWIEETKREFINKGREPYGKGRS